MEEIIKKLNKYMGTLPVIRHGYYTWEGVNGTISIRDINSFCFRSNHRGYILDTRSGYNQVIIRIL